MAPARTSTRRAQRTQNSRKQPQHDASDVQPQPQPPPPPLIQPQVMQPQSPAEQHGETQELFLDPMSGQPLQLYVEKDVENKDALIESVIVSAQLLSWHAFAARKDVDEKRLIVLTAIWWRCLSGI